MNGNSGDTITRATGLLVIEVRNSNPNGNPDQEGDPRQRAHDQRGEISPVSFKRKLRDLVAAKDGPVWEELGAGLDPEEFHILESRGRDRSEISRLLKSNLVAFQRRYWDGRIFGNTFLEDEIGDTIRTGVVQFGVGISVAPVRITRHTTTNFAGVEADKSRGMAPLGFRVVEHGVYCMPFFVNPTAASKSGCTSDDIDLLLRLIPCAYPHTKSYVRHSVEVRHAWYIEHKSRLGSCSDFELIDRLTPKLRPEATPPSTSWGDYDVPHDIGDLQSRVASVRDLANER